MYLRKEFEHKLDHLDKINIFYAKSHYKKSSDTLEDLNVLYNLSCGNDSSFIRPDVQLLNCLTQTLGKLDMHPVIMRDFFSSLFSNNPPGMKFGPTRDVTPEIVIEEILSKLSILHVNTYIDGEWVDQIGLGNVTDNERTLDLVNKELTLESTN